MLVWFEIKKYLLDYKRILFCLVSSALTCVLLITVVNVIIERQSLFEPFTVGVVDNGNSPEIRLVFDFFSETAIQLAYMDKAEAEERLKNGDIPAYVELPERFAQDIMVGTNTPFRLYGNNDMPLQWALSKLLASGGVAFLSASQAGIYATLDYAREQGLAWDYINRYILFPINVAFINNMLRYEDFFVVEIVELTGEAGIPPVTFFVFCFTAFLMMLNSLSFLKTLTGYNKAVYDRFKLAGYSVFHVQGIRFAGLLVVNMITAFPLYGLAMVITKSPFWYGGFALAFCVSAVGFVTAALFKSEAACGLFIFIVSLAMLFLAGGIVPIPFLPQAIHGAQRFMIPYWAAAVGNGYLPGAGVLVLMGCVLFMAACAVEVVKT